ncbi:endonuclease, partial [Pueribacillus theae]
VFKLNLYMQYGVKEYWIVNPLLNSIQIYSLDNNGQYEQQAVLKETGTIASSEIKGFKVNLEELFK